MNFYKVKFLKNGQAQGRTYTYKSSLELVPGDKVELPSGSHGVVVNEPVDLTWVETYGEEKLKEIAKKCDAPMIVKNWSIFANDNHGFHAPETCSKHLQGNVFGNPKFHEGDPINTSRIIHIEDMGDHKDIITKSGSRYSVYPEDVNPECEKQFPNYYERLRLGVIG